VIGNQKFAYNVWGDTAKRMETYGLPGRVHVSAGTRQALGDAFRFEPRGTLEVKGKGSMETPTSSIARAERRSVRERRRLPVQFRCSSSLRRHRNSLIAGSKFVVLSNPNFPSNPLKQSLISGNRRLA
jgi:Adenylate and Guanylate cyclase catalytic domain